MFKSTIGRVGRRAAVVSCCLTTLYLGPFLPSPRVWPEAFKTGICKLKEDLLGRRRSNEDTIIPLLVSGNPEHQLKEEQTHPKLVSVVIPVHNEGKERLKATLERVYKHMNSKYHTELILVNAGSTDNSFSDLDDLVSGLGLIHKVKVVVSKPERGDAVRRGASAAGGDLLFFLHADTCPPKGFDEMVRKSLSDENVVMCAFEFGIDKSSLVEGDEGIAGSLTEEEKAKKRNAFSRMETLTNLRSHWLWLPYGDQGFGISRDSYRRLGGFKQMAMMEDFEFSSRVRQYALAHHKRVDILPEAALCSPRRWEKNGVLLNSFRNWFFVAAFVWGGVDPKTIFNWYYNKT